MSFTEAIQSCLKNYVGFKGRAPKSEYNYWMLFTIILTVIAVILDPQPDYPRDSVLANVVNLALFFPSISVLVRRLHDQNKSGWHWLWTLTIVGNIPLIYWLIFKVGDSGSNNYGVDALVDFSKINS